MIVRPMIMGVLLVLAVTAQTALFPLLPTGWFRPDLMLLVVVAVALADGPLPGIRVGFAAGLITDMLTALAPAGIATVVLTVIGFAAGTIRPYLAASSVTAPLVVALTSGVIGTAGYGMLALLLGDDRVTWAMLAQSSIAVGLYNVVLAPIVIPAVARVVRTFPRPAAVGSEERRLGG